MKRIHSFDFIKFFAILGVLIIHSGIFWGSVSGVNTTVLGFILNTLARFAVPFFFITAGFMFKKKTEERGLLQYYSKYIFLIIIPYLLWSFLYLVSGSIQLNIKILTFLKSSFSLLDFLYYGKDISEPLWFLPGLFFSITIVAVSIKFNFLKIVVIISLLLNLVGLFGINQNYYHFFKLNLITRDALFFGLFYTSLGSLLAKNNNYLKFIKKPRFWFLLSLLFTALMNLERAYLAGLSNWQIFGDFYISTIPLTFSLFMGCLAKPELGKKSFFTKLGRGSLGIYVIHTLIMVWYSTLIYTLLGKAVFSTIYWHLLYVPVVFILSWFLYYFLPTIVKKLNIKRR